MKGLERRLNRLRFFAADAWDEWRHSPGVNVLALATLVSALFLAGLFMLVLANVERSVGRLRSDVRVEIYLEDGIDEPARQSLHAEIAGMAGVERVDYVDKQKAMARYREWAAETAELIAELESNPLPASFEAFLRAGPEAESHGSAIVVAIAGRDGVEEVRFNRDWLRRVESLLDLAQVGGGALALVEIARRSALGYAGSASRGLLDIVAAGALPLGSAGLLVLAGLAVSLTGSYFAVKRGL